MVVRPGWGVLWQQGHEGDQTTQMSSCKCHGDVRYSMVAILCLKAAKQVAESFHNKENL